MTSFLLFIKHRLPLVWRTIEWINGLIFRVLFRSRLVRESQACFKEFEFQHYEFRPISKEELSDLVGLLARQSEDRLAYFRPHGFDLTSINSTYANPAFFMFGVYVEEDIVGYFSLRCFANRKAFVGRLIDEHHEGKGIGRVMNKILYNTVWRSGFRCFTTISKHNAPVMRSHSNDPSVRVLKDLPSDYLLIEFVDSSLPQS